MRLPIIDDIISERPDGQIGDGVYVAYEWIITEPVRKLCRIYLGTRQSGPILQYDHDGYSRYNGWDHINHSTGVWTPIYSRGNYGRRYACGGNWSVHARSIHTDIANIYKQPDRTTTTEMIVIGDAMVSMPDGIKGDISLTDIDCSGSWAIWYPTARDAMSHRLRCDQIITSLLPSISRNHLIETETADILRAVWEVINAYKL